MTNRGRSGGRNPPNHGRGHGASWRPPVTTTSVHISTAELIIPVVRQGQGSLPSVQEFMIPTNGEGSIPFSREPTPKYPPVVESTQPVDLRPLLSNFKNKSAIVKANRAVDKRALAYYGGSISTIVHYEKLVTLHINHSN
ncbi:hypothetical protein VNO78_25904 [Psophocarpus tetragonolobus]|uniref:Uncharacterized protein n=1 Tax=Psophocarpus tetragonolobus TaxID=3891 RepID=A0AAN9S6R0_PSOTE